MSDQRLIWVTEVHNVGGFFGGDTITLSAMPWPAGDEETLTIDEKALPNVRARHVIMPEMLLHLEQTGDRIDQAQLLAARERELLNDALRESPPTEALSGPRIRAYRCARCDLWITGQPRAHEGAMSCAICHEPLE